MIPMTGDSEKLKYYITDVRKEGDSLVTEYADKNIETSFFNEHNLNVTRNRMIDQARTYLDGYYDFLAKEIGLTVLKKYGSVVLDVVGMFFLYNIDIHVPMKIVLTFLCLGAEAIYWFINNVRLSILGMAVGEAEATKYYVDNLRDFKEYNAQTGLDEYIVPIEDIGNHKITKEMLEDLSAKIREFKEQGVTTGDMKLAYKPQTKTRTED